LDPTKYHSPKDIFLGDVVAPNAYTITKWCVRDVTVPEFLEMMDVPASVIKHASDRQKLDEACSAGLLSSPPLKILQEVGYMLFGRDEKKFVDVVLDMPAGAEVSFNLRSKLAGMDDIYKDINQAKAAKNDDAATDFALWERAIMKKPSDWETDWAIVGREHKHDYARKHFDTIRGCMQKRYVIGVELSYRRYMEEEYGDPEQIKSSKHEEWNRQRDVKAGAEALRACKGSTFWDWDTGSFPHYWRWQPEIKEDLRDGTKLWVNGKLPKNNNFKQKKPREKHVALQMIEKLEKVRYRWYIAPGWVEGLTSYFPVPKGESDIRLVYDMSASGLNAVLWVPGFWLPSIYNVMDSCTHLSWFGDVDIGEMFLNFPLDLSIRAYCGVDLTWIKDSDQTVWECWQRMAMGLRSSPWVTTRLVAWMVEFVIGDKACPQNPFRWDRIVLNLPGDPDYNPSMPRVYKWNDLHKAIASGLYCFMDDFRLAGPTEDLTKRCTHRLESRMSYLGIQDATRKRRPITQRPGEWNGSIIIAVEGVGLFVTVTEKKWLKTRNILEKLDQNWAKGKAATQINYKQLDRDVGFLVHLSMTYPEMTPFLRGFYLTMNSWRKGRDKDGWKLSPRAYRTFLAFSKRHAGGETEVEVFEEDRNAPIRVDALPVMREHLTVLLSMFDEAEPALKLVRGKDTVQILYSFGDASGEGFGSSSWEKQDGTDYRVGIWGVEGEDSTSNWRESKNLACYLEAKGAKGELVGKEIFLFTDNTTAESIAHKGSSSSPLLYDIVVRLTCVAMKYQCSVEIIHVSGKRMISQGTDGLSRGDMLGGVMRGEPMLRFVPLNQSAVEDQPRLMKWINSWAKGHYHSNVELLSPNDWVWRGHDIKGLRKNLDDYVMPSYMAGTFVWSPPPAAAKFALEQIRQARQKRQDSFHIFVCRKVMTKQWMKHTWKAADLRFELPAGHTSWEENMFEPLTVALFFSYSSRKPWELKHTKLLVDLEGDLRQVLKDGSGSGRDILSKLCGITCKLEQLSFRELCQVLSGR
jgi:hypothetical protein